MYSIGMSEDMHARFTEDGCIRGPYSSGPYRGHSSCIFCVLSLYIKYI